MPPLDRMFELSYLRSLYLINAIAAENAAAAAEGREANHIPSTSGDPERVVFLTAQPLKPELTKSFEVGVKQNFGDLASLEVTAFYKDQFDKTDAGHNYSTVVFMGIILSRRKRQKPFFMSVLFRVITEMPVELKSPFGL
jgi:hypothetical protein